MSVSLSEHLPLLAAAPNGIRKLRELILELAVRGKLMAQDASDEPASDLLKRIAAEKKRLLELGKIKQPKAPTVVVQEPFPLPKGWAWSSLAEATLLDPRNAAEDALVVSFVPMALIGTRFDGLHGQESRLWGEIKQGFTHFAEGDIGIAKITPCFENSKACLFSGLTNGLGAGTTELHIIRTLPNTIDPRYVLAYVKSPQFLRVGETRMTGTAGQKRLPKNFVEANPLPVPPLAEQHRIVAKVDELMALCDRLEAQQADAESAHAQLVATLLDSLTRASDSDDFAASWQRLSAHFHLLFTTESSIEELKQSIVQLAVMGKLVPQDCRDEPASDLLKHIAAKRLRLVADGKVRQPMPLAEVTDDEKPVELPTQWMWSRLGSQVVESGAGWSPACGSRPREGNDWGVLKVSAVSRGVYQPDQNKALPAILEARPELEVADGDFLVSRANTAELVARSVVVEKTPAHLMLSDKIVRLKLTESCDRHYMNLANSSPWARDYYSRVAGGTSSSMKNVSREQILNLPIAVPPLAEQSRIVAKVDQLLALCDRLKLGLSRARQLNEHLATALVHRVVA